MQERVFFFFSGTEPLHVTASSSKAAKALGIKTNFKPEVPYSEVRDEGPLLDGLVVGGLCPHQAQVKGQTRVVRTHYHG